MTGRTVARASTLVTAAIVLLVAVLTWAPPAAAHDALVLSDPAEAGTVTALPSRATLTFSGEVAEVLALEIEGPDGSVVNGTPSFTGTEVRQNLWSGPDGDYVLTYEILSEDGHEVGGEVRFEQGPAAVEGVAPSADGHGLGAPRTGAPSGNDWGGVVVPVALVVLAGGVAIVLARRVRRGQGPAEGR